MPRRRVILLTFLVLLVFAAGSLALVSWEGAWHTTRGRTDWQVVRLGAGKFGLEPVLYWSKSGRRLLVVPFVASAGGGLTEGERLFAYDPAARTQAWIASDEVDLAAARILPWQSSQEVIESRGEIELVAGRHGRGARASMHFEGITLSLPRYQLSFPAFAEAGWRLTPRRFGRLRLILRDASGGEVAGLERWLFNSMPDFDFLGAVSWVDEGRFLVFRPHQGAPPRLWILGPL